MTDLTPYEQLRAARKSAVAPQAEKSARAVFDKETARARQAERNRRNIEARRRAWNVLASLHDEEFQRLLATERDGIDRERGPLPGDQEGTQ